MLGVAEVDAIASVHRVPHSALRTGHVVVEHVSRGAKYRVPRPPLDA
jgi:hypothetical protein